MARRYNVYVETLHPYTREICWPDLLALEKHNIARRDHALRRLQEITYEAVSGLALRDRQIGHDAMAWARGAVDTVGKNSRETFLIREYIITLARWDD